MSKVTEFENVRDLAVIFYNDFIENGGDVYEPDSKFSKLLNEIDETLLRLFDFKTANDLEGKIISMSSEECEQHYIWGFEKALEVARVVYGSEIELDQFKKLQIPKRNGGA